MVVLFLIAILALMAIPMNAGNATREQVKEALQMVEPLKDPIAAAWKQEGSFPADNAHAHLPYPEQLIGNYVTRVDIRDGAIHISFGNKAHEQLRGKILSLQPLYVPGSTLTPVSWNCGYSMVPMGMKASGANQTDIDPKLLPIACRKIAYAGSQDTGSGGPGAGTPAPAAAPSSAPAGSSPAPTPATPAAAPAEPPTGPADTSDAGSTSGFGPAASEAAPATDFPNENGTLRLGR